MTEWSWRWLWPHRLTLSERLVLLRRAALTVPDRCKAEPELTARAIPEQLQWKFRTADDAKIRIPNPRADDLHRRTLRPFHITGRVKS